MPGNTDRGEPGVTPESEYQQRLDAQGGFSGHMPFMREVVLRYPEPQVIELGVGHGNSTAALLSAVLKADGALFSCDTEPPGVPDAFMNVSAWTFLRGNDLSPEVLTQMPLRCDVLLIDSDYAYDHMMAVLRTYVPRMKKNGIVLLPGTEWQWPDVQLAFPSSAVARALGDYCAEAGLSWENKPGSYGLGIIKIPGGSG